MENFHFVLFSHGNMEECFNEQDSNWRLICRTFVFICQPAAVTQAVADSHDGHNSLFSESNGAHCKDVSLF